MKRPRDTRRKKNFKGRGLWGLCGAALEGVPGDGACCGEAADDEAADNEVAGEGVDGDGVAGEGEVGEEAVFLA